MILAYAVLSMGQDRMVLRPLIVEIFTACREEIVAGSVDGTIRRFDVRAGCLFNDDVGQSVTDIAVSGDGLCVLGACLDGRMRLLDKATGTLLAQYRGEHNSAYLPLMTVLACTLLQVSTLHLPKMQSMHMSNLAHAGRRKF